MISLRASALTGFALFLLTVVGCSGGKEGSEASPGGTAEATSEFDDLATPPDGASSPSTNTSPFSGGGRSTPATTAAPVADSKDEPKAAESPLERRTSLAGRWVVVTHQFGSDVSSLLLDITTTDSGFEVKQAGESPLGWTLTESSIDGPLVHLTFADSAGQAIEYHGKFDKGMVRGNAVLPQGFFLASLQPTAKESLGDQVDIKPVPNIEQVQTVLQSLQQEESALMELAQIAKALGAAPLAYQLYNPVFSEVRRRQMPGVEETSLMDDYLAAAAPWGDAVVDRANLDIGYTLAILSQAPEQALEYLDRAEKGLTERDSEEQSTLLQLSRGLVLIDSDEEDVRQQGLALLQKLREDNPYNVLATGRLAEFFDQQGQLESALEMHAELVIIPSLPGNINKLAQIWQDLGNDPQDLDAYLDEVYEHFVYQFAEQDDGSAPVRKNQHVMLGELFTGMTCPPCVPADIATGALEQTYPKSQFLMIRYHQHIPGPDPLTVADGESRREYYDIRGTPALYVNGGEIQGTGGNFFNSPGLYYSLRNLIAPLLEETTELTIELSADAEGEQIKLRAAVGGAEEYPETWRLRLCLTAEAIPFPAPNGIRLHEMVVRAMPGGANGIAVDENGKLQYEADISVAEIRDANRADIDSFNERYRIDLPVVPRDLENLHVVAFVQDDVSQEILQAASTPVNGVITLPPEEATEEPEAPADAEPSNPPQDDAATE